MQEVEVKISGRKVRGMGQTEENRKLTWAYGR